MIRRLENLAAAVAFAEVGEHQTALEILDELKGTFPTVSRKIVLVSTGTPIKPGLVEYGLGLADRMHYQSLFLNVLSKFPGQSQLERVAAQDRQTIREQVETHTGQSDGTLLRTGYATVFGNWRTLVQEAVHRLGGVEMVILQKARSAPCTSGLTVPVFCLDQ